MDQNTPLPQSELKKELVSAVLDQIRIQEASIKLRNEAMDKRYNYAYGTALTDGLPRKSSFDDTQINFVRLVPEIMSNQLWGRGFTVTTTYDKEDLSAYDMPAANPEHAEQQKQDRDQARIKNARAKTDSDLRAQLVRDIIKDNGGLPFFFNAGELGSWSGISVIKHWLDREEKRYKMVLLENPNNFWRAWSNSNFREWDWSAYISYMSKSKANRDYGEKLEPLEFFETYKQGGSPWQQAAGEDLNNTPGDMVYDIDLVGYIPGFGYEDGQLKKVERGDETEMAVHIVGGKLVSVRTEDLPEFEVVANKVQSRNPWGVSDITDDAMSINRTLVQVARSWITLAIKSLFYKMKFKGFTDMNIPQTADLEVQGFAMDPEQDIEVISQPQSFQEFERIITWLTEAFVRVTRIGMVMFSDPTAVSNSNQAMMTGMKPLTDTIEKKQAIWSEALERIFRTALLKIADAGFADKSVKEAVRDSGSWEVKIEWPSILRREDNAWQTLWLNLYNAGAISWSTFVEKVGPQDTSEELDRMRDDMADPVRAAAMGKQLPVLAQQTITQAQMPPQGPPSGLEGVDAGGPGAQVANPVASPDMNAEGTAPVSQPGSGLPTVSPEDAAAMAAQRAGA